MAQTQKENKIMEEQTACFVQKQRRINGFNCYKQTIVNTSCMNWQTKQTSLPRKKWRDERCNSVIIPVRTDDSVTGPRVPQMLDEYLVIQCLFVRDSVLQQYGSRAGSWKRSMARDEQIEEEWKASLLMYTWLQERSSTRIQGQKLFQV